MSCSEHETCYSQNRFGCYTRNLRASLRISLGAFRACAIWILARREYIGGNEAAEPLAWKANGMAEYIVAEYKHHDLHSIALCAIRSAASKYPLLQYSPASFVQTNTVHCPSFKRSNTSSGLGSRLSKSIVMTSWPPSSMSTERPGREASSMSDNWKTSLITIAGAVCTCYGEQIWQSSKR